MKTFVRALKVVGVVLLVVVLAVGGLVGYVVRSPMPQTAGNLSATGLQNQVDVYRDGWGVPHIYADSAHDLFFAQGYVHAQDRFWQMEFWRRIGSGRLSEVLGDATLGTDRFIRTLGWARVAAEEVKLLDEETRFALQSYADGVNAYLDTHNNLGLEFTLLGVQGVNYKPEPWTIVNTLTWAKAMSWDLGGNMDSELERAQLIQLVGADKTLELKPLYPSYRPVIIPNPAVGFDASKTLAEARSLNDLLVGGFRGIGSNNWVISGALTDTGKPYLANDPHLGIQMPSIWYEVGLHCRKLSDVCPFEVTGFSFAGAPGVIIGHNNRIAWGVTNLGPDVQDLFIEKLNPGNPNQYEVNGAWTDAQVLTEVIMVRGKIDPDPKKPDADLGTYNGDTGATTLNVTVRLTRHGPIINDIEDAAANLSGEFAGTTLPTPSAIALRWTALDPSFTFQSVLKVDQAQNFDEFRTALRDWNVPSQNFVYADVDGNIGYQSPGLIPIRASGDGLLPVPGWTDEHEWTGFIPFDELPYSFNPPQGYIATANNAVVGPDYPYLLSLEWSRGYRAQRIVDMIEAKKNSGAPITIPDIQAIQGDGLNLSAQEIVPFLAPLSFEEAKLQAGLNDLKSWDFQQSMNSSPAALYNFFWARLVADTFNDDLPEDLWPDSDDVTMLAVHDLLARPDSSWWDNVTTTGQVETRDDILRQAFAEAYADAESRLGADRAGWEWGKLHTATFSNATLGRSGISAIEALFNRGPVMSSGGDSIVNATGYRFSKPSDKPSAYKTFEVNWLPSMRMIVDLSNFGNSLTMHTTGQSGHPFSQHYDDMIDSWRLIKYHPMLWDQASVEAASKGHLALMP